MMSGFPCFATQPAMPSPLLRRTFLCFFPFSPCARQEVRPVLCLAAERGRAGLRVHEPCYRLHGAVAYDGLVEGGDKQVTNLVERGELLEPAVELGHQPGPL